MTIALRKNIILLFTQIFILVFSLSLLQSCGFRLRGASELPNTVKFAVIDGVAQFSELGLAIKQQLVSSGAKVLTKADVDTMHFVVLKNEFSRRVLSVDSSGRANEYELTYESSIRVLDAKGNLLVAERTVSLNRNYIYDLDNALAKSDEEASIKLQMISLAVRQSMRRIGIKLTQLTNADSRSNFNPGSKINPADSKNQPIDLKN